MEEFKEIRELLTAGMTNSTIKIMEKEINNKVLDIINISKGLEYADEEQLNMVEQELEENDKIISKKTMEGEVVGLDPKVNSIIKILLNNKRKRHVRTLK